jgi:hypothetical protein
LAARAAERGHRTEARRHLKILQNSGLDSTAVANAIRRAVAPMRQRIQVFCQAAVSASKADPTCGDTEGRRLLEDARPLLAVFDLLLGEGDPGRDNGHDEIVLAAVACQVEFANRTEDWETSLETLKLIEPLAMSAGTRQRVQENIRTVEGNLTRSRQHDRCWFCERRPVDMESSPPVALHQIVIPEGYCYGTPVRWRTAKVRVPRCRDCRKTHSRPKVFALIGGVAGCLAGALMAVAAAGTPRPPIYQQFPFMFGLPSFLLLVVFGSVIGGAVGLLRWPRGVKKASATNQSPLVQELLQAGWALGDQPNQMIYVAANWNDALQAGSALGNQPNQVICVSPNWPQ